MSVLDCEFRVPYHLHKNISSVVLTNKLLCISLSFNSISLLTLNKLIQQKAQRSVENKPLQVITTRLPPRKQEQIHSDVTELKNVQCVARHVKFLVKRIKQLSLTKNMVIGHFGHYCCLLQQKMENANVKWCPARICNRCVIKR